MAVQNGSASLSRAEMRDRCDAILALPRDLTAAELLNTWDVVGLCVQRLR